MFNKENKRQKNQGFFSNAFLIKNHKAQVGKTMTWIVATIIIIVILLISFFMSTSYLGKDKKADFSKQSDILASKSFFAYLLTEDSERQIVYEQLRNEENLNDFNGNLAIKIFKGFYGDDYKDIWLGIIFNRVLLPAKSNDYFGRRPKGVRGGDVHFRGRFVSSISEEIELNENKSLELYLGEESSIK